MKAAAKYGRYPSHHPSILTILLPLSLLRPIKQLARAAGELLPGGEHKRRPKYNPARPVPRPMREVPLKITEFSFNNTECTERVVSVEEALHRPAGHISWLNIEGLDRDKVPRIAECFGIHSLLVEDILEAGQRAKMDEIGQTVFCLLPMLYYNEDTGLIESEQVSLVLVPDAVLSFQEEAERDVFGAVRVRLASPAGRARTASADYLLYSLLDAIVDSYFAIMERLDERAERLEHDILHDERTKGNARVALLRREILTVVRAIAPVREVVNGLLRSDSDLRVERNDKYYKDVLDHILHAIDAAEGLRDNTSNLQELVMNQVNMKTNEIVKVFTIITTLLAPATVIGGIFGMNFDVIPLSHQKDGFFTMVALMLIIPIVMLWIFKRKGWF